MRVVCWLGGGLLALGLVAAPGESAAVVDETNAEVVFGVVEAIDLEARTLGVRGETYHVPPHVAGLADLAVGDPVAVYYRGPREVARLVTDMQPR